MKIKLKKKTMSRIVIPFTFLLLLLLILGYFYFENRSSKQVYDEVLEKCDLYYKDDSSVKCPVLLNSYSVIDKEDCFDLSVVGLNNNLFEYQLCVSSATITWDQDSMLDVNFVVPLYWDIEYENKLFGLFKDIQMNFSIIEDSEIPPIFDPVVEKMIDPPQIKTSDITTIINNGYYLSNPLELNNTEIFGTFVLFEAEVLDVSKSKETLDLKVQFVVNGEYYQSNFLTKALSYYTSPNNLITVNSDDLEELKTKGQITFFYLLNSSSNIVSHNVSLFCGETNENISKGVVCNDLDNYNLTADGAGIDNIEESFLRSLSESTNKDVDLDYLILGYIYPDRSEN